MELKVLDLPLQILKISGLDPTDTSYTGNIKCVLSFLVSVALLITSIIEICWRKWRIISIVPVIETFMAVLEVIIRLV